MNYNKCLLNLLKLIKLIQDNSIKINNQQKTYNTRIISLYNKDGSIYSTTYNDNNKILSSTIFRIHNITKESITLLILKKQNNNYYSTNQFITINISCIAAVQCLNDVIVSNISKGG